MVLRFDPSKIGGSLLGAAVEGDGSHSSTCDDKESAQVTFDLLLSSSLLDEPAFGKVKVMVWSYVESPIESLSPHVIAG